MRVQFSSVVAIFIALLFVSGTVGCRSNGGDWYNPNTYSWTNPFARDGQDSPRPSNTFANTKPSLDAHPTNISIPPGGYSDGAASIANRSVSPEGVSGSSATDPWGRQNPVASNTPPSHLSGQSGYTVAEPSSFPPAYITGMVGNHSVAATHQQQQHIPQHSQFPQEMAHHHMMPYGPSDYVQTGFHQPVNHASAHQHPVHHAPMGTHGGGMDSQGNYAPFGTLPQNNSFGAIQQPVAVPPTGFGFEQHSMQAPHAHHQSGLLIDGGFHHQPSHHQPQPVHQFPPSSGNHW